MEPEGDFEAEMPDLAAGDFGAFAADCEELDSDFAVGASDFGAGADFEADSEAEADSDDGVDVDPLESFDFSARLSLR